MAKSLRNCPSHQEGPGARAPALAAIDLGTNNCRLLLARPTHKGPEEGSGFQVIEAFSRIVRLGEGLEARGRLSEAAMARTVAALKICAEKIRRHRPARVRAVATAACRAAGNCDAFVARVRRETGLELEIISSAEEAELSLRGCAPLLTRAPARAIVFDIGGGSTEVTWLTLEGQGECEAAGPEAGAAFEDLRILGSDSLPLGVVSFTERFGGRRVKPEAYRAMVAEVQAAVAPFEARHALGRAVVAGEVQMLGTSGTVTTIAGVHQGLPRYDRRLIDGCRLDFTVVREILGRIRTMGYDERVRHPCIGPNRADLVVAGCAILDALCQLWPVGALRVADRGLREGMLHQMMTEGSPVLGVRTEADRIEGAAASHE